LPIFKIPYYVLLGSLNLIALVTGPLPDTVFKLYFY